MATYKVLQDIEAEDKLLGPLTLRQFVYGAIAVICLYLSYFLTTKGAGGAVGAAGGCGAGIAWLGIGGANAAGVGGSGGCAAGVSCSEIGLIVCMWP